MKQVRSAVLSMDGHLSRGEFLTLCQAVYEVREQLPEVPQMKSVYADGEQLSPSPSPLSGP